MRPQPRYQKGDRIGGRYRVYKVMSGGMGVVYLCIDQQHGLPFALKTYQVVDQWSNRAKDLFNAEVNTWVLLGNHPNIVRCHHLAMLDSRPYAVLELVRRQDERVSLRDWLRGGPLSVRQSLAFVIDICRGMRSAQEKLPYVVHRDLKPENVLVDDNAVAKVTDFGLALVVQNVSGGVAGTPTTMAPEQWRGEAVSAATDVYAVGCVLYECLTGKPPFTGNTMRELRDQHLTASITRPGAVPQDLWPIIDRCLSKPAADRYPAFDQLEADLVARYTALTGQPPRPVKETPEILSSELTNEGVTFDLVGNFEAAIERHTQAIAATTEEMNTSKTMTGWIQDFYNGLLASAYNNRGVAYTMMGRYQDALADFEQSLELENDHAATYVSRGYLREQLGDLQGAVSDYSAALGLNDQLAKPYSNRGAILGQLGYAEASLADLTRAVQLDPTDAEIASNYAVALHHMGYIDEALQYHRRAVELDPDNAGYSYNLGIFYGVQSRLTESAKQLERAHQLGYPNALEQLRQVRTMSQYPMARAFEAFLDADTPDKLTRAAQQYPALKTEDFLNRTVGTLAQFSEREQREIARRLVQLQSMRDEGSESVL